MGVVEYLIALAASSPAMALWIAVIIYGAIKLKRGGGRAERFLIVGGSIKLLGNLIGVANIFTGPWLIHEYVGTDNMTTVLSGFGILHSIVSMTGFLCLICAFWVKFHSSKELRISL